MLTFLVRYEQQQGVGLAVRKYVLMRRGFIASDAQRKPGLRFPRQRGRKSIICWHGSPGTTNGQVCKTVFFKTPRS